MLPTINQTPASLIGRKLFFHPIGEADRLDQVDHSLRRLLDDYRDVAKPSVNIHREQFTQVFLPAKQLVDQKPLHTIAPNVGWYRVMDKPNHLPGALFANLGNEFAHPGGQYATLFHLYEANDHRLVWGRGAALLPGPCDLHLPL